MNKFKTFLKLNSMEKFLLIKSFFLLLTVRIMLWILPFSFIKNITGRFSEVNGDKKEIPIERLTWAIGVMSMYTPRATCLTQAIAGQILLARYNYSSSVKIGVSKYEEEFEAHAWLEKDEKIVLGESENEYKPIIDMG